MLKSLHIKNYALIKNLRIDFHKGFSVITGETGAGKSIMLGALALLLGKRADSQVMMDDQQKCIVDGTFDISRLGLENIFKAQDIDFDQITYLRREILPSGRSRAFINDTPVKLELLKKVGERLVNIHSQHETLMLGDQLFQLEVLDAFISEADPLIAYQQVYREFKESNSKLSKLLKIRDEAKRDEDYFRFQFEELDNAQLDTSEYVHLREREKLLENSESVIQTLQEANSELIENEDNLITTVENLTNLFRNVSAYMSDFSELSERLASVSIELKDIAGEISRMDGIAEFDPEEVQKINDRLNLIYHLQQKHHAQTIEGLIELREVYASKINKLDTSEEEIEALAVLVKEKKAGLIQRAASLTEIRRKNAKRFSQAVKTVLQNLALKDAVFEVRIDELEDFSINGLDRISFLFNANKGGTAGEISSVASGGELSRLMLAVKSLVTKEQLLPTVIFDEIDSGVSGDIASKVGTIMLSMSRHHQLIAISHLPQIAAKANHHYRVYKQTERDKTYTFIQQLGDEDRVEEIAKLLSDETISIAAMDTAKELLK